MFLSMEETECVVVRVWLPDRPGALGAVASRIGAVRGDVIAIDVLERGGGRAVDELTVSMPAGSPLDLLVAEIGQVDGVDVEDIRPAGDAGTDRAVRAVRCARILASQSDLDHVAQALCTEALGLLGADWVAVLDAGVGELVASAGSDPPPLSWLSAFIVGVASGAPTNASTRPGVVDELAYCQLGTSDVSVVVSRAQLPLRAVERNLLDELAGLADHRMGELRPSLSAPSRANARWRDATAE